MKLHLHSRIKNSGQDFPSIFYGKHFTAGIAGYTDGPNGEPYNVFISEDVAKAMDPSFATKPIYVDHVDGEQPNEANKTIDGITQDEKGNPETKSADGYIIESFFLPADGAHWVKMLITSAEGMAAIARGWKLSNCYTPESLGPGNDWHGISYQKEFLAAEYNHMAIVQSPRYRESIILTPEEFKNYCSAKEAELVTMRNSMENVHKAKNVVEVKFSQGVAAMKLNLMDLMFGKKNGKVEKIENANDIGKVVVKLGKNREVTIAELIRNSAKLKDADYVKLMNDEADRPDLTNDEDEDMENDLEDIKDKKNKKKSNVDEDMDDEKKNDERVDQKEMENEDSEDEMENDEADDAKMKALREKQNRKKSAADELDDNKENDDEGMDEKKNKSKKNAEKNTPADEKLENDDEDMENDDEDNPLMNEIDMDGEKMNVGDLINSHVELKNKFANMKTKHNELKNAYSEMCNKFGQDDAFENDADIPERDEDMQAALGKLENEEKALETSLANRQNSMTKIISRMKNKAEAIAKREQKKQEGENNFKKIQNAELEAMLNSDKGPTVATETSASMVDRGRQRYGSK